MLVAFLQDSLLARSSKWAFRSLHGCALLLFRSGFRMLYRMMLEFMDYIQQAFAHESKWNRDNSYSNLNATAQGT